MAFIDVHKRVTRKPPDEHSFTQGPSPPDVMPSSTRLPSLRIRVCTKPRMRWELEGQQMQDGTGNQTKDDVGRIGKECVKQK